MTGSDLYGAIEAGGTKFVCAIGTGPDDIRAQIRIPTTTPAETIGTMLDFFRRETAIHGAVSGLGIASFGPVDLVQTSPTWGYITTTPKRGWANTDLAGPLATALACPVGFETDVNGAALGEARWGAGQGVDVLVYITVGTGLGGGILVDGKPVHGLLHPELGHIRVPKHASDLAFAGVCPFHGDCLEGLASGPAIQARWGTSLSDVPADHSAMARQAHYLGHLCANLLLTVSANRILLGGGVMQTSGLLALIQSETLGLLNGYLAVPAGLGAVIQLPALGQGAGLAGAFVLAMNAW
jgi:fructokinase